MKQNRKSWALRLFGAAIVGAGTLTAWNVGTAPAEAAAPVGKPAPAFSVRDTAGNVRSLAEFRGRYVILEWVNHDCPFVVKHYSSGNMQNTQRAARQQGAVWLSVNSSKAGAQGHTTAARANELTRSKKAAPSALLLDTNGRMGRAYAARTTPHMFIINPQGSVIYNGAIDNKPSTDTKDIKGARNHVLAALTQARKGQKVSVPATQPYGCSIKY